MGRERRGRHGQGERARELETAQELDTARERPGLCSKREERQNSRQCWVGLHLLAVGALIVQRLYRTWLMDAV